MSAGNNVWLPLHVPARRSVAYLKNGDPGSVHAQELVVVPGNSHARLVASQQVM